MNSVILFGRLGKKPELRTFQNGGRVANSTLATDESYRDKEGNKVEQTEWHNLVFRNNTAEVAEKYLTKGSQILVRGKLKTRSWETQQGDKRYATEVIVDSFEFGAAAPEHNQGNKPSPSPQPPVQEDEDELPF